MKRSILLIAAALFLFAGNQSVTAQAKLEKEVKTYDLSYIRENAKKKTESLVNYLGLNEKQQEKVYNLFVETQQKSNKSLVGADSKKKKAITSRMERYISDTLKEILTEDQLKKYLAMSKDL
ncbi:hypothetical protein [Psychroserpens sp.]|uniref:hypothetical protein n=1 Tax=Psychroserpens sp. TaxID=2020870 RepID=UPI00385A3993